MKSAEPRETIASGLTSPAFIDITAGNGKTYEYAVTAANSNGESAPSSIATVVLPKPQMQSGLLPAGQGRELTARVCSGCHSLALTANEQLSDQGWHDLVRLMAARGAVASDDELNEITGYLARSFPIGTKKEH
jgi:cytochrome c1